MRFALFALALTLPAGSSALPAAPAAEESAAYAYRGANPLVPSRICGDDLKPRTARSADAAKPRRLGELPPGDLTLTVVNRVGDCIEPMVVRQRFGGSGR